VALRCTTFMAETLVAAGGADGELCVWRMTGLPHGREDLSARFHGREDLSARFHGREDLSARFHGREDLSARFHGRRLPLIGCSGGNFILCMALAPEWSAGDGDEPKVEIFHGVLAVGDTDGHVHLLSGQTGEYVARLTPPVQHARGGCWITSLQFMAARRQLLACTRDGCVWAWTTVHMPAQPQGAWRLEGSTDSPLRAHCTTAAIGSVGERTVAVAHGSVGERTVAVAHGPDGAVTVWHSDLQRKTPVYTVQLPESCLATAVAHVGGLDLLAVGTSDGSVVFAYNGRCVARHRAHGHSAVRVLQPVDVGKWVTGSADGTVVLWSLDRPAAALPKKRRKETVLSMQDLCGSEKKQEVEEKEEEETEEEREKTDRAVAGPRFSPQTSEASFLNIGDPASSSGYGSFQQSLLPGAGFNAGIDAATLVQSPRLSLIAAAGRAPTQGRVGLWQTQETKEDEEGHGAAFCFVGALQAKTVPDTKGTGADTTAIPTLALTTLARAPGDSQQEPRAVVAAARRRMLTVGRLERAVACAPPDHLQMPEPVLSLAFLGQKNGSLWLMAASAKSLRLVQIPVTADGRLGALALGPAARFEDPLQPQFMLAAPRHGSGCYVWEAQSQTLRLWKTSWQGPEQPAIETVWKLMATDGPAPASLQWRAGSLLRMSWTPALRDRFPGRRGPLLLVATKGAVRLFVGAKPEPKLLAVFVVLDRAGAGVLSGMHLSPTGRFLYAYDGRKASRCYCWPMELDDADDEDKGAHGRSRTVVQPLATYTRVAGTLLARRPGHACPVTALASASDGRLVISGGSDGVLCLWHAVGRVEDSEGTSRLRFAGWAALPEGREIQHLAVSDDNSCALAVSRGCSVVHIVDLHRVEVMDVVVRSSIAAPLTTLCTSSSNDYVGFGSSSGHIEVHGGGNDTEPVFCGTQVAEDGTPQAVTALAIGDTDQIIASAGPDGIRLWDFRTEELLLQLHDVVNVMTMCLCSYPGVAKSQTLATASNNGTMHVLRLGFGADGELLFDPDKAVMMSVQDEGAHCCAGAMSLRATPNAQLRATLVLHDADKNEVHMMGCVVKPGEGVTVERVERCPAHGDTAVTAFAAGGCVVIGTKEGQVVLCHAKV
jgi:WD40 repeat protein